MKSRLPFYMTIAVLVSAAIILAMNAATSFGIASYKYLSPNDVRGMAVEHNQKLYTLNFAQQNFVVDLINNALPLTTKEEPKNGKVDFSKIVIYRFNAPDIEIHPIAYISKENSSHLVFSVPALNPNALLQDNSSENVKNFFSKTYDH